MGAVVLLTGPSSAGKTSVGQHLRRLAPRPTVFLDGDEMDLPQESEARRWLRSLELQEVVELEDRFFGGFYDALAALARAGLTAVGEVLFKKPEHLELFRESTRDVRAYVVHVTCPEPIRIEREANRCDRPTGTAKQTALQEWVPLVADLVLDTSSVEADAAARLICEELDLTS